MPPKISVPPESLLDPDDVSEWIKVPKQTLYRWRATGDGPRSARMGKHLRYRRSDVEAWIAERMKSA